MSGLCTCAWVTQALREHDVEKALVLGKSLRKVLTRKALVVIVHSSIALPLREELETTFDLVLSLDEGKCRDLKGLSSNSMAKAFTLTLTLFNKCIFLDPSSLVLKNCDDLFHLRKDELRQAKGEKIGDVSPLYLRPCQKAFKKLSASLATDGKTTGQISFDGNMSLLKWMRNQTSTIISFLGVPYSASVALNVKQFLENDDNLVIVHLKDLPKNVDKLKPETNGFKNAGLLEKFIYNYWLNIYETEVRPKGSECLTLSQSLTPPREPIAVVGVSCRHPSSSNISEFWDLLIESRDGIRTPPDYRWTKEQSLNKNPDIRNTSAGFLNVPVDEFDAKFFGISPKDVVCMDPQIRLLHEVVYEALEDAGVNPLTLQGTSGGVFMGSWRNDYLDVLKNSNTSEFYRCYMGNSIGAAAARISHLLGLTGPSIATESGCSAAMVAVHMACKSLQNGESNDIAIACGVNLLLHPFTNEIMPMVAAKDGRCKTFDSTADGFGRAEGCAVLVLKRLSQAIKDGDRIWGLIRGTAISQEGISKSMGTPTIACEAQAMENALEDADVNSDQVSYVECHGTGTIVGDPLEVAAITKVYGGQERKEPLIIGSVKTNVGHTESCSGITGIIKVLLSLYNNVIPKHMNFKELNPEINLEAIPAMIPLQPVKWERVENHSRFAGVSSFGITGTDAHVIVQDAILPANRITMPKFERPLHLLKISAKSEEALDILLERYKTALSQDEVNFADIAYTSNVGRATFPHKAAVIASDANSAADLIKSGKILRNDIISEDTSNGICFLFTGQGSQYHGMAKELYDTSPVFQMHFDYCEDFLWKKYKISIAKVFFSCESEEGNRTLYSQTGIFVIEFCLMKLWESWRIKPTHVLGHSLGEFCSAVCAGIITVEDALTLVAERSILIDKLPEGKMLVLNTDQRAAENLLKDFVSMGNNQNGLDFAAINSLDQTVLAGDAEIVEEFAKFLEKSGKSVKFSLLKSTHAFHSRHMDPILKKYGDIAHKIRYEKPNVTFISGMMGQVVNELNGDYWISHTRKKVEFLNASKIACEEIGCRTFIEMGPHPVLSALVMLNNENKSILCLPSLRRNEQDWKTLLNSVGKLFINGVEIDWKRFDQFYNRKKVGHLLPHYPFIGSKYWPCITSQFGIKLHPLLGSIISNPTSSKLFQCNLSVNEVEYLKDHVITDLIVFPGAGYMEMLLMAGCAAMEGMAEFSHPRRPILLKNFRIEAPLGLDEEKGGCLCQTVVQFNSLDESEGLQVNTYHEQRIDESNTKWIGHASGKFLPYSDGQDEDDLLSNQLNYSKIINSIKEGKEENISNEFYDRANDAGLKFGPAFRTLQKVWRSEKQEFLAQVEIPKDSESYLVHPTLIDGMIQTAVIYQGLLEGRKLERKLTVPIGCDKFIWFNPLKGEADSEEANICYIYSNNPKIIRLLDSNGNTVAALVKAEVIETTAKTIIAMLETQVKSMPETYTIEWRATTGPGQRRLDFTLLNEMMAKGNKKEKPAISDLTDYSEREVRRREALDEYVLCNIIIAFLDLGWEPILEKMIGLDEFTKRLGIIDQYKKLSRQFLTFLEEEGILEWLGGDDWKVKRIPSKAEAIIKAEEIIKIFGSSSIATAEEIEFLLLRNIGLSLDKFLSGKESALKTLFPEDEKKASVEKFYNQAFDKTSESFYSEIYELLVPLRESAEAKGLALPIVRVLEVGAGTGSGTDPVLRAFTDSKIPFEYVYTDISAAFFPGAEARFDKYKGSMKFKKLNLEQDPSSQGFPPKYFDMVIASQVVHATKDIRQTLVNIKQCLRNGGFIYLHETLRITRGYDCIFGLLEGYWRFEDFGLRPHHPTLGAEKWLDLFNEMGFSRTSIEIDHPVGMINARTELKSNICKEIFSKETKASLALESEVNWIIFYREEEQDYVKELTKHFDNVGRKRVILVKHLSSVDKADLLCEGVEQYQIKPDEKEDMDKLFSLIFKADGSRLVEGIIVCWGMSGGIDQNEVARPFLYLLQNYLKLGRKLMPQIILLTNGQQSVGELCCENPSSSTLIGMAKCILNEHTEIKLKGIDVNILEKNTFEIFQEIFTGWDDSSYFTSYRGSGRFIPKFVEFKGNSKALQLPSNTDRFQLILPKSKSIMDLEFGDLETFQLKLDEVEVKVKCSALNFKDILNILKPVEEFKKSNQVGFDFSGVVTKVGGQVTKWGVGDAVFGINMNGNALPSHVYLKEDSVVKVPSNMTFNEAACFPAVSATAYYCLVTIAQIKKGETLLIHTASGGVGLVAIQMAKYFGLEIICTAGSKRKRAYLRSLGIQNVFHSRNTLFGNEILQATGGKGVDIVLNSLTGTGFKEATLGACAKGARFIEMSKLNIWSEEEVEILRPDIKYTIVDLTKLDEESSRKLLNVQSQFMNEEVLKPIPFTRYDAVDIRNALGYLQKAQHIGKVVCTMPENKLDQAKGQLNMEQVTPLFNDRSTYLITGGLGGIGMEVCKYMVGQGARNILLAGRSPPTEANSKVVEKLKESDKHLKIIIVQADVGIWEDCLKIFDQVKINNLPPLRGIMHAAGALSDGVVENLTWEDFQKTFKSKIEGSWNLHELTKHSILEHFVFFSSIAAVLGSPGQASHVSACTFEDNFALYRNSQGLTGTSINWGQFGQIGVAAEAEVSTIRPFTPQQGINALDWILRNNHNYITVVTLESSIVAGIKFFPFMKRIFDDQVLKSKGYIASAKKLQLNSIEFWEEYHECKDDRDGKVKVSAKYIKIVLRHVLRLEEDEAIDESVDLQDMGVDSLMMLELKNHVQTILGERITLTQSMVKDCNTVKRLSNRLVEIIEEEAEFSAVASPSFEEIEKLILLDSKLGEEIKIQVENSERKASEMRNILFTGATGSLGSHLLAQMLENSPQIAKVYCLIRPRAGDRGEDRLKSVLTRNGILPNANNLSKVVCIQGNQIDSMLGLAEDDYDNLCEEIDGIVHCGGKVSHTEYYRLIDGGRNDTRNVNVTGLRRILEFACKKKTKHLFNMSALLTVEGVSEDGSLLESWPDASYQIFTKNGYVNSKHVCDLLLKQAVEERGIPCKNFKITQSTARNISGKMVGDSHVMKSFLFFLKEGILPATPTPLNIVPLETCVKIISEMIFNDEVKNEVFNISHPRPQLLQECFPLVAEEMGYSVKILEMDEYRKRVLECFDREKEKDERGKAILAEFQEIYRDDDSFGSLTAIASGSSMKSLRKFLENQEDFFMSKKLAKLFPEVYLGMESSYEILKGDLETAKKEGVFEKLGIS